MLLSTTTDDLNVLFFPDDDDDDDDDDAFLDKLLPFKVVFDTKTRSDELRLLRRVKAQKPPLLRRTPPKPEEERVFFVDDTSAKRRIDEDETMSSLFFSLGARAIVYAFQSRRKAKVSYLSFNDTLNLMIP